MRQQIDRKAELTNYRRQVINREDELSQEAAIRNGGEEQIIRRSPEGQKSNEAASNSGGTRKLTSSHGDKVEIGTKVHYKLDYTGQELWSGNSHLTYKWTVINPNGKERVSYVEELPEIELKATIPGTYTVEVEILDNSKPTGNIYSLKQKVFYEKKNTELGQLSVGNFDFYFDGTQVIITVRVKFSFEETIPEPDHAVFKTKFFNAVRNYWTASGVSFKAESGDCFTDHIPLIITCQESNSNYHKLVDVEKEKRRPFVFSDINLSYNEDERYIAHEFGHVLGLYDEYAGNAIENTMFWHNNDYITDTDALMNSGSELRKRYFEHYLNQVNSLTDKECKYKIEAPFKE